MQKNWNVSFDTFPISPPFIIFSEKRYPVVNTTFHFSLLQKRGAKGLKTLIPIKNYIDANKKLNQTSAAEQN